ncbi:hypothetical protein QTP86_034555, partial [Hemibagrus guttatus]
WIYVSWSVSVTDQQSGVFWCVLACVGVFWHVWVCFHFHVSSLYAP